jgi:hypothetical protein
MLIKNSAIKYLILFECNIYSIIYFKLTWNTLNIEITRYYILPYGSYNLFPHLHIHFSGSGSVTSDGGIFSRVSVHGVHVPHLPLQSGGCDPINLKNLIDETSFPSDLLSDTIPCPISSSRWPKISQTNILTIDMLIELQLS